MATKKGTTPLTNVRLSPDLLARIDALKPAVLASPEGQAMAMNRSREVPTSYVIRLALALGLSALEEQYAPAGRRRK